MFLRIKNTNIDPVTVNIDGRDVEVDRHDTVAAAALLHGLKHTRTTPVSNSPRAPFCLMGVCYDCLMVIDGQANQRACLTKVKPGMKIESQQQTGSLSEH